MYSLYHSIPSNDMMPTLSLIVAPKVVVMKTPNGTNDNKVGIMSNIDLQRLIRCPNVLWKLFCPWRFGTLNRTLKGYNPFQFSSHVVPQGCHLMALVAMFRQHLVYGFLDGLQAALYLAVLVVGFSHGKCLQQEEDYERG